MSETVIDEALKIEDIRYQVMNYVKEKLPVYKTWADQNLEDHIAHFMGLGQMFVSQKEDGQINGVLSMQYIDSTDERHTLENKRNAEGVFIDIFIADNQKTREELVTQAMLVSGVRKWIAFERCKYNQRVSKLPWSLAERIACYGRR